MSSFTSEEVRQRYIDLMGLELGEIFNSLWQEVVWLHVKWAEYVELFGMKQSRIDLLNESASQFFFICHEVLWEGILLQICRLTDPPITGNKRNLSILQIPDLIADLDTKTKVNKLVKLTMEKSEFCRDWRNRHIAHKDYNLTINPTIKPLAFASRNKVDEAINSIAEVLNCVTIFYEDSTSSFGLPILAGGAASLLYVLSEGLKSINERNRRLETGEYLEGDFDNPDI